MKKALLLTFMVIIGLGCAYAQKITLISPNGGETLTSGMRQLITWTYSGLSGDEIVIIALEGATDYGPIAYSKVSQGSLEWLAGQKMDGLFAKPAADYRIIIEVQQNDSIYDVSNHPFTITLPLAVVSLMKPNGGESLEKGRVFDINWACSGKDGFVSLTLFKDDQPLGLIAENLPAASLHCSWHVGSLLLNGAGYGIGGNYRVQIQWRAQQVQHNPAMEEASTKGRIQDVMKKNSDSSDGVFAITLHKPEKPGKEDDDQKR